MSKFLLNLLVQISKALVYSKIQFLFRKEFSSDFVPSGPALPVLARFARQAAVSTLSTFGLNILGVFAKRCISFDFAHSGNDAFSLSHHCHVGPARQLHPLPHAGGSQSRRRLRPPCVTRPPASRCQSKSLLPRLDSPFLIPPLTPH
jgi:hypothetical protein